VVVVTHPVEEEDEEVEVEVDEVEVTMVEGLPVLFLGIKLVIC
jgi:hypothetical protein